ncbi:MAG: hypothetical protein ACE5KL_01375 [Alphaproteobacteria bacterium]
MAWTSTQRGGPTARAARRNRQAAEVPHAEAVTRPVEVTGAPVETARRLGISLDEQDRFAVKALPLHPFRDLFPEV